MNTQLLSPETKIKLDSFIELVEQFEADETDTFSIKPSLIAQYLEEKGFEHEDTEYDCDCDEVITLKFQKSNSAFIPYHERYSDDDEEESEEDDDEPQYFLINLVINYMESVCFLTTNEY